MQKSNWLRIGFVSALALAGATTAIACGGDDEVEPGTDGGLTSSSSSGDNDTDGAASSSGNGSSSGGSSGAAPVPAALAVVHGFNALGAVKICYAISPSAVPELNANISAIAPLPAGPTGLLPGSGGILPGTGLRLSTLNIRPYLVKVASIPTVGDPQCPDLFGDAATVQPALVEGQDYFSLEPIPAGTLKDESTFVLVARESATEAGKPAAALFELDTATDIPDDKIGVQFIHASNYLTPALPSNQVAPFIDRLEPAINDADAGDAGDGGDNGAPTGRIYESVIGADNTTKVAPFAAISAVKVTDEFGAPGTTAFGVQVGPGNIPVLNRNGSGGLVPIQTWARLSDPANGQGADAASLYYKAGNAFTFIAVGDPAVVAPANPTTPADFALVYQAPHFLVFPNKPIVPTL